MSLQTVSHSPTYTFPSRARLRQLGADLSYHAALVSVATYVVLFVIEASQYLAA